MHVLLFLLAFAWWLGCNLPWEVLKVSLISVSTILALWIIQVRSDLLHLNSVVLVCVLTRARMINITDFAKFLTLDSSTTPTSSIPLRLGKLNRGFVVTWTERFSEELMLRVVKLLLISIQFQTVFFSRVIPRSLRRLLHNLLAIAVSSLIAVLMNWFACRTWDALTGLIAILLGIDFDLSGDRLLLGLAFMAKPVFVLTIMVAVGANFTTKYIGLTLNWIVLVNCLVREVSALRRAGWKSCVWLGQILRYVHSWLHLVTVVQLIDGSHSSVHYMLLTLINGLIFSNGIETVHSD